MRYLDAVETHIAHQYAIYLSWDHIPAHERTREYFLSADYRGEHNAFTIARNVMGAVAREFGELVSFGTFDNCREHGVTVSTYGANGTGWTFCTYQHRNSDEIHLEGCPTTDVEPYGPYGGEDKFDTLHHAGYGDYDGAATVLTAMMHAAVANPSITRQELKSIARHAMAVAR